MSNVVADWIQKRAGVVRTVIVMHPTLVQTHVLGPAHITNNQVTTRCHLRHIRSIIVTHHRQIRANKKL